MRKSTLILWRRYRRLRLEILERVYTCLESVGKVPRNLRLFAFDRYELFNRAQMPGLEEARLRLWLRSAINRCKDALENPDKTPRYLVKRVKEPDIDPESV
jgi:hypothetical protein